MKDFHLGCLHRNGRSALAVLLWVGTACTGAEFTADEWTQLEGMKLQRLPPSPSNKYADQPEAARLGQQFFFDVRFSGPLREGSVGLAGGLGPAGTPGRVSCSTCHDPAQGGADSRPLGGTSLAAGWTGRNGPTVLNAAHSPWMFWDGRKDTVWSQALGPIENPNEHNTSRLQVAHTIFRSYREPYEKVFGPLPAMEDLARFPAEGAPGAPAFDGMNGDDKVAINRVFANFGKAIEAYERLLVDASSPFDRFLAGNESELSPAALRGARLFVGKAACNECHAGPMLADGRFHNHGVGQIGPKVPAVDRGRFAGIALVQADEFNAEGQYSDAPGGNRLREITPRATDEGAFKTPTLRNVSKTAPYMHTGAFVSLWDVVVWYNEAAGTDRFVGTRAPASKVPLKLSIEEVSDLVEFLKALDADPLPTALVTRPPLP